MNLFDAWYEVSIGALGDVRGSCIRIYFLRKIHIQFLTFDRLIIEIVGLHIYIKGVKNLDV